jgi:hypothetical protein
MNRLFPIRSKKIFAIRLSGGDLYKYDDGKVAMGTRSYLNLLMDAVLRDFSDSTIIEVKPFNTRVKK